MIEPSAGIREGMELQEATPADITGIQAVGRAVWHDTYAGILAEETITAALEQWYSEAALRDSLTSDDAATVIAVADGRIIGYGTVQWRDRAAELKSLYVLPDHQDDGVGTALFTALMQRLPSRVTSVTLRVLAANTGAKRFYEHRGFDHEETTRDDLFGEEVAIDVYVKRFDAR